MEKHSKRYRSAVQVADLAKDYPLSEAVDILAKFPKAKFDETVELSVAPRASTRPRATRWSAAPRRCPNGSGKKVRVLVFTDNAKAAHRRRRRPCRAPGHDGEDQRGLARLRRRDRDDRGDEDRAHDRARPRPQGPHAQPEERHRHRRHRRRHQGREGRAAWSSRWTRPATSGSASASAPSPAAQILENAQAVLEAVGKAKPASFKGHYIKTVALSSSQSPSVRIASTEYGKY